MEGATVEQIWPTLVFDTSASGALRDVGRPKTTDREFIRGTKTNGILRQLAPRCFRGRSSVPQDIVGTTTIISGVT